jgi:hypothetical protein
MGSSRAWDNNRYVPMYYQLMPVSYHFLLGKRLMPKLVC